ncbi:hypothetical protein M2273_002441 [Mucilaginibacter lappiensis]
MAHIPTFGEMMLTAPGRQSVTSKDLCDFPLERGGGVCSLLAVNTPLQQRSPALPLSRGELKKLSLLWERTEILLNPLIALIPVQTNYQTLIVCPVKAPNTLL